MASKNSRTSRSVARSSRAPQSARAIRAAKASQSGRIGSNAQGTPFSEQDNNTSYRPAYTPGMQGRDANNAYGRQTTASQYSRANPTYAASARKSGRGKKIAVGVIAAVIVAVIGGGSAFAIWTNSINEQLNKGTKTDEEISAISDALSPTTSTSFTEPFYMMLIGSDRLDDDPSAGARSDTNIVVRVDPTTNQATMVSIPRDTRIDIDDYGINKFNAAYNYDGAAGAIREAKQLLGVDISHYAEVNFDELKDLVDAVGGVDLTVDELVDDPDADGTSAHPEWPRVIIEEGEQHLNGNQALVFARSRAYVDGDFTRTQNQRKLIMAIVNKVLSLPVTDLPGVVQSAASAVTTDLSVNDIISLAQQFRDGDELTIYSEMVPSYTQDITENGVVVSYVINDEAKTKEMMKVVESGGNPEGIVSTGAPASSVGSTGTGSGDSTYGDGTGNGASVYNDSGGTGYDPTYDPTYGSGGTNGGTNGSTNGGYDDSTYYDNNSYGEGTPSTGDSGTYDGSNVYNEGAVDYGAAAA